MKTLAKTAVAATDTHTGLKILVGPGVQQQPHAVNTTIASCPNQRRPSALSVCLPSNRRHRAKKMHNNTANQTQRTKI